MTKDKGAAKVIPRSYWLLPEVFPVILRQPLHALTHKSCPSQLLWTEESQASFSKLCSLLSDASFLTIPTQQDFLLLQTDTSTAGIGGCLSEVRDGQEFPAAFYSRKLTGTESRYAATELECLAVVECIRQLEAHMDGHHFSLQTDHKALEYLNKSKLQNKRLARRAMRLQGFDFTITYRPGKANGNADGLSRQAWSLEDQVEDSARTASS